MGFKLIGGLLLAGLACAAPSCTDGSLQPYLPEGWNPGVDGGTPEGVTAVTGRLWARPNPLLIPGPVGNPRNEGSVDIQNIGTEPVVVTGIVVEGGAAFEFPAASDIVTPLELHPGSGFGFAIFYDPQSGIQEGTITVHTSDPTSPSLVIPMRYEPGLTIMQPESDPMSLGFLRVAPNPIRLHRTPGTEVTTRINLDAGPSADIETVCLLSVTTLNAIVEVEGIECDQPSTMQVQLPNELAVGSCTNVAVVLRVPAGADAVVDDALVVAYDKLGTQAYELRVPILVRQ